MADRLRDTVIRSRSEQLVSRYRDRNKLFVETEAFREAREILVSKNHVMVTGGPGEGKSTIAIQLLLTYSNTHEVIKLASIEEWNSSVNVNSNQIVMLDDVFGVTTLDSVRLQTFERFLKDIKETLEETNSKTLVVLTSRKSILTEAVHKLKENPLLFTFLTVDMTAKFRLLVTEKQDLLRKYINETKPERSSRLKAVVGDIDRFIEDIGKIDSPIGFPQCVYMFMNEGYLMNLGSEFFRCPLKYLRKEIDTLYENDRLMYAFLILLSLVSSDHKIREKDIHEHFQSGQYKDILVEMYTSLHEINNENIESNILKKYNGIYLKRFTEDGLVGLQHISIFDSICHSYCLKFPGNAIAKLAYDISVAKFVYGSHYSKLGLNIQFEDKHHSDMAKRFVQELKCGNLQTICTHSACKDQIFAYKLVDKLLQEDTQMFTLMERERDVKETFNGSLLYWSAVSGARELCTAILEKGRMEDIKDTFWLRTQATATLMNACMQGFGCNAIEMLCKLGACPLCGFQPQEYTNIKYCDACAVHLDKGWDFDQETYVCSSDEFQIESVMHESRKPITPFQALIISKNTEHDNLLPVLDILQKYIHAKDSPVKVRIMGRSLATATKHMKTECVRHFLDNNCKVDIKDEDGLSALWYAVKNDDPVITKLLIDKGASVKIRDKSKDGNRRTMLMSAQTVRMASLLLDVDQGLLTKCDSNKMCALHMATSKFVVEYLVNKGLSVHNVDMNGQTPLHVAKTPEIVHCLIKFGADINAKDKNGRTPLECTRDPNISMALVDNISLTDCVYIQRLLAMSTNADVIQHLIQKGASVHKVYGCSQPNEDNVGMPVPELPAETFIHQAGFTDTNTYAENTEASSEVSGNGCHSEFIFCSDDNQFDDANDLRLWEGYSGKNALLIQAKRGTLSHRTLETFLSAEADMCASDEEGNILHHMLSPERRITDILKMLETILLNLNKDDINFVNKDGNTPLHIACSRLNLNKLGRRQRRNVVDLLLYHGANPSIINNKGEYPAHVLLHGKCRNTEEILKKLTKFKDVDIDQQSKEGCTLIRMICGKQFTSLLDAAEALRCTQVLLNHYPPANCGAKDLSSYLSPILLARHNNLGIFERLLANVPSLEKEEILQLIESCVVSPHEARSWSVLNILVKSKRLRLYLEHTHADEELETVTLNADDIDVMQVRTQAHHDIITMMLCLSKPIECKEVLHEYFLQYIKSMSFTGHIRNFKEDINHFDKSGRSVLMQYFHAQKMSKINIKEGNDDVSQGMSNFVAYNPVEEHVDSKKVLEFILNNNADTNAEDSEKRTVLNYCISCEGSDEFVNGCLQLLLAHRVSTNKGTPLLWAVQSKYPRYKVIETLLKDKNIYKCQNVNNKNVVYMLVERLVQDFTANVISGQLKDGERQLKLLSKYQVEIDNKDTGCTALQYAVKCFRSYYSAHVLFNSKFIQALLEVGADPNVFDANGRNTLHDAVMYNNYRETDLLKVLTRHGGNVYKVDNNGWTVLHCAVQRMNHDSVKTTLFLLQKGVNVNMQNNAGETALHMLVQYCQPEKRKVGEDMLRFDHYHCGPLRPSVLRCLLNYNADVNLTDNQGKSALDYIVECYNKYQHHTGCDPKHMLISMASAVINNDNCEEYTKEQAIRRAANYHLNKLCDFLRGECSAEDLCNL